MFEDTKWVFKSRKLKDKTTQWPNEKGQRTNNDLQNTTQKPKDRTTRTPLKTGGELMCSGRVNRSCSTRSCSLVC